MNNTTEARTIEQIRLDIEGEQEKLNELIIELESEEKRQDLIAAQLMYRDYTARDLTPNEVAKKHGVLYGGMLHIFKKYRMQTRKRGSGRQRKKHERNEAICGDERPYAKIAKEHGISKQRVEQIKRIGSNTSKDKS